MSQLRFPIYNLIVKLCECMCNVFTRIQWLEKDFLKYIQDWEKASKESEEENSRRMCLSSETIEGLRITGTL